MSDSVIGDLVSYDDVEKVIVAQPDDATYGQPVLECRECRAWLCDIDPGDDMGVLARTVKRHLMERCTTTTEGDED